MLGLFLAVIESQIEFDACKMSFRAIQTEKMWDAIAVKLFPIIEFKNVYRNFKVVAI